MSATFNWAYKPGITNKYGITIIASTDDVKPSNATYVALFGNDTTGNGSRKLPYRTITKAAATTANGENIIVSSGTYRESIPLQPGSRNLIGDGDVIIDASYFSTVFVGGDRVISPFNITFRGNGRTVWQDAASNDLSFTDCTIDGGCFTNAPNTFTVGNLANLIITNSINTVRLSARLSTYKQLGLTLVNCNNVTITNGTNLDSCIFSNCNISFDNYTACANIQYSLFHNCNFKLNGVGTGGGLYPIIPTGYTNYTDIDTLRNDVNTVLGISKSMIGCTIADPKFNNLNIGDYSLQFDSPAKNLSYLGTYVGARSIAYPIKAKTTESAGDFDFSSSVNLAVTDNSITFIDSSVDAQIDTNVIGNIIGRELAKIPSYGFNADRNGQYIDSIADLSSTTYAAGDALPAGMPFIVEGAAIIYNSATLTPGARGTTIAIATTFSTVAGGVIREIVEAPQRHTIMARFSDGYGVIPAGTALVIDNWYYVVSGSITYNSNVIIGPIAFKAVDTNTFSGTGVVELAMSTESYQHYEPGIKPTSNNTGDSRIGVIIRGNGDPTYDRGGMGVKEFPINAKYMQYRFLLKASNLRP